MVLCHHSHPERKNQACYTLFVSSSSSPRDGAERNIPPKLQRNNFIWLPLQGCQWLFGCAVVFASKTRAPPVMLQGVELEAWGLAVTWGHMG